MAKNSPTFTIVTPSYNQARYLGETIQSVLNQAGSFSLEYIVADGGSNDGSVEVIKNYDRMLRQKEYPIKNNGIIFKWWSRPDKGQSDAINQGFKKSKGLYVAWLNSDDLYEPGALHEAQKVFKKNPDAGMVYGNYSEIDSRGEKLREISVPDFDLKKEISHGNMVPQPSVFMKRATLFKAGLLNPEYHYAMDYDLWIRIGSLAPVVHVEKYWSRFRLHNDSKTVALAKKFFKEEREISREHGAPLISQHLINHLHKYHPRLAFLLIKAVRAHKLFTARKIHIFLLRFYQNLKLLIFRRR